MDDDTTLSDALHNLSAHDPVQLNIHHRVALVPLSEDVIGSQILMGELRCHVIRGMHSDPSEVSFRFTEVGIDGAVSHLNEVLKRSPTRK